MSPFAALKHPWITKNVKLPEKNKELLKSIFKVQKRSIFQHFNTLILSELLSSSDQQFIKQVKDTFLSIDQTASGCITKEELCSALDEVSLDSTLSTKQNIFMAFDIDQNDTISYSEWMSALVYQTQMNQRNLQSLFQFLDIKKKGAMSVRDLERAYRPHIFRLRIPA